MSRIPIEFQLGPSIVAFLIIQRTMSGGRSNNSFWLRSDDPIIPGHRERDYGTRKRREKNERVENKSTTDHVTNCSTEIEMRLLKSVEHYPFDFTRVYGNTRWTLEHFEGGVGSKVLEVLGSENCWSESNIPACSRICRHFSSCTRPIDKLH